MFTFWGNSQPNDRNGSMSGCVAMNGKTFTYSRSSTGGYWFDLECNLTYPALCQQTSKKPPKIENKYPGICPVSPLTKLFKPLK